MPANFKATVNDNAYDIQFDESGIVVNGVPLNWDLARISGDYFHVISNNVNYSAEVVSIDRETKSFSIKVNGRIYPVKLKDKFDLLLEKMGLNTTASGKVNTIKAPMPGLIIDLRVKAGDMVKAGDPLLILEAMKMENIIKAAGEAVVKSVHINKGDSVEKNQVLIEF